MIQIRMPSIRFVRWFLPILMVFLAVAPGVAAEEAQGDARQKLEAELADVRARIVQVQQTAAEGTKDLWQKQHALEYADPDIAKLREEMKAIEAQLVLKRQELAQKIALNKDVRAIEDQRKAILKEVMKLREEEQLILNELKALEFKGPES